MTKHEIELTLCALRMGAGAPLTVRLHGAPAIELSEADAKPVRLALLRVVKAKQRALSASPGRSATSSSWNTPTSPS